MKSYRPAFAIVTVLFFMWGFITCMNDILIPFVKAVFELTRAQSMLIQMAFFSAYFFGSLIYFIISTTTGDPIQKIGYKNGIVAGLIISAIGTGMLYPAAGLRVYGLFLAALFILGLGFTLLQIAANPYVAILGEEKTASGRLNLSQGFNSFGTTIAPIIGGYLVFHLFSGKGLSLLNAQGNPITLADGSTVSAMGVQIPYLIFTFLFVVLALVFIFIKLPQFSDETHVERGLGALRYRHLLFGMFAIFFYVGGEVSIGSIMINYLHELKGFAEMDAKSYLALYWGGLMIGRFIGAYAFGQQKISAITFLGMLGISILGFGVIYTAIYLEGGKSLHLFLPYIAYLALNILAFYFGRTRPGLTLSIFAGIALLLIGTSMFTHTDLAMWSILGIGLFNSIMWSNIFTLAIKGLGKYTSQGSSLLVMMILGGALLPFITGHVADILGGYQKALFVPAISYLYLMWYGLKGSKQKNTIQDQSKYSA
ncbi:MAG: sugar MFS transporter [Bacteroidales bacterium]|nr:sugar MFS transporter [Bacteroidales bacterium]HOY37818.1 sugar MFS transporter [Bacteroidales bacterium]HQP04198.1 sugar MFS transporter [Bacteroidales bacterium]